MITEKIMPDFTREIQLEPRWNKRYKITRAILYAIFVFSVLSLSYKILFPTLPFSFSFHLNSSSQNNIINPHDNDEQPIKKGVVAAGKKLLFDTALMGNFSNAKISIILEKGSSTIKDRTISLRKSYQAFFYPLASPIGFKNGSLLSEGPNYYIVSNDTLRKFSSLQQAQILGFTKSTFTEVSQEELKYNKTGPEIIDESYPDYSLFLVNDEYYQLKNNQLYGFTSTNAFLSRYDSNNAIKKDSEFLEEHELSEDQIGPADGSLVSVGTSVFILSASKLHPIDSPITFESMGYSWKDVKIASSDEIGIFKKQKIFFTDSVHPNGTIFKDANTLEYFIIENGQKHPLLGKQLIASYLKINPVLIDSSSLQKTASCTLKKDLLNLRGYSCSIPLEVLKNLDGNDYQFVGNFVSDIRINRISVLFNTSLKKENFKGSISAIINSIKSNYAQQQQ